MKQLAIIDNIKYADIWKSMISEDFLFEIAESVADFDKKSRFDAVIVNADFAGNRIKDTIAETQNTAYLKNKPMAIMVNEYDEDTLEYFCSCGVNDILRCPICSSFMVSRINMMIAAFSEMQHERNASFDFDDLLTAVYDRGNGAMCVPKNEFASICSFVQRGLERSSKSAQVLLFTLNSHDSCKANVMSVLSEAVQKCLRKGDMSSVCSSNQILALLTGADDDGGHLVANRIVSNFYSECDDENYELQYDIREVRKK